MSPDKQAAVAAWHNQWADAPVVADVGKPRESEANEGRPPEPVRPLCEAKEAATAGRTATPFMDEPASPFHNVRPPHHPVQRERSVHRLAAYLFTTGLSQRDIAERLDVTPSTVSNWWRQPWFQDFVKDEMAAAGRDTVHNIVRGAATDSVFTLIRLRDDERVPSTVRRACCSEILDRAFGKAPQTVHSVTHDADNLADIGRVDNELRSLLGDQALMQSFQPSQS